MHGVYYFDRHKRNPKIERNIKESSKARMVLANRNIPRVCVRTCNNDTWLKALKPTMRLKYPSLTAVYR